VNCILKSRPDWRRARFENLDVFAGIRMIYSDKPSLHERTKDIDWSLCFSIGPVFDSRFWR